ncbi:MAG: ABC transporter substrate-binding protein [Chloroflexota bacterium]
MQYFIGLDDTDNHESRGTGHLARVMAESLAQNFRVHGIVRHQLLEDERVPKTSHNSSATIIFEGDSYPLTELAAFARKFMLDDFQPGSDPGLCVASEIPDEIVRYGQRAQREFLHQQEPRALAAAHGIHLEGLGGTEGGVIGALASVGLSASGNDGRYVLVGSIRTLSGLQPLDAVLASGIASVRTPDGQPVSDGLILADKLRPARRDGQPILFVERDDDHWLPLKLD